MLDTVCSLLSPVRITEPGQEGPSVVREEDRMLLMGFSTHGGPYDVIVGPEPPATEDFLIAVGFHTEAWMGY